ncbi:hypothetical protein [Streptomyces sp. RTd22]|uniref:hypothetical protein n=1 Tax=Streptomyces sp. RTd22 TaxID=1841249 RepID=UPI0007C5064B|nr:hypothetical protein [Streptomyces sp. RTd22]
MATTHIAVAGAGPVNRDTVYELLDDWLGIDANGKPTTDNEVLLVIPAAAERVTPAVKVVYNWSGNVNPEVPYTAIVAQTLDKASKVIRDNAEDAVPARDDELYTVLGRTLAERDGGRYLLVAGDEGDDELRDLVDYALDEDITVLDLRDALKQITPPEPEPEETQQEDEPEEGAAAEDAEEPCKGGTQTLVPLPEQPAADEPAETLEDEVAAAHRQMTTTQAADAGDVVDVLEAVVAHLRLVDESNAAANLAEIRYRPITALAMKGLEKAKQAVRGAQRTNALADEESAPAAEKPAKRPTTGKVRKEWLNPKTNEWEPLRGRPRRNVQIREVAA